MDLFKILLEKIMNEVIKGKGFHISYALVAGLGWMSGDTTDENALVKDGKFYILNGDFREDYQKIVDKGFKACKKFFDSKKEHKSSWSN